jgi:hypothetical protein
MGGIRQGLVWLMRFVVIISTNLISLLHMSITQLVLERQMTW